MAFQVRLTHNAETQIEATYLWFREQNPPFADQWFRGLMDAIAQLQDKPRRFPLALEQDIFGEEVRQFPYGKGRSRYRVLFSIVEPTTAEPTIYILHIRHAAQSLLTPEDLGQN
jgi:plasmid stabilization system protein ParE